MNKKFFTLAAALMMGSAFTVNAQTNELKKDAKLDGSTWYYLGTMATKTVNSVEVPDVDKRVFIGGAAVYDGTSIIATKLNNVYVEGIDVAETSEVEGETVVTGYHGLKYVEDQDFYLWKVKASVFNGAYTYEFTNKATGKVLAFKDTDGAAPEKNYMDITHLLYSGANKDKYVGSTGVGATGEIEVSDGKGITNAGVIGAPANLYLYTVDHTPIEASALNDYLGDGFALSFPDVKPQPTSNIFDQKITAVSVDAVDAVTFGVPAGTYLVLSAPKNGITANFEFASKSAFNSSTMIAVDPKENFGLSGYSRANGYGFGFKTVVGRELKSAAKASEIDFANAVFTFEEQDFANAPGSLRVSVSPKVQTNSAKDEVAAKTVYVSAITSTGKTYVTTVDEESIVNLTMSQTNMVAPSDILKKDAPTVFNIQFLDGTTTSTSESQKGKYLGYVVDGNDDVLAAQGASYLNLNAPQNQWVISEVTEDGQFVFTNRENAGVFFTTSLRATDKANIYELTGVVVDEDLTDGIDIVSKFAYAETTVANGYALHNPMNLEGQTVKLAPVTVDPAAGYVDFTKADLINPAVLKFTVSSNVVSKDIYVTASLEDGKLVLSQDEAKAAKWKLIKNEATLDSIYGASEYAYIVKNDETKTASFEDKAITTYKIKMVNKDLYLNYTYSYGTLTGFTAANVDPVYATDFAIKQNADGSVSLVVAPTDDYDDMGDATLGVDKSGEYKEIGIYDLIAPNLFIELAKTTPSLASVSRHASFESVNGGFLGVGATGDAMIAATKDEAAELTFWLDTTDVKEATPSFYISQGIKVETKADAAEVRNYLWNPADSASYYDEGKASYVTDKKYHIDNDTEKDVKAMFRQATWVNADSLNTVVAGKEVGLNPENGLNAYKFQIVLKDAATEGEYVIRSVADGKYLKNINGKVAFGTSADALVVTVGEGIATANEAIAAESGVQVIGGQGVVTVQGAAGKVITVANILGQTIANQVAASDNVTIAVPAGIVVVAVDGEATKVVVK